MAVTTLLYNQYLQTIIPPKTSCPTLNTIEIALDSPKGTHSIGSSRILALPLELRLQIYSHALTLQSPKTPDKVAGTARLLFTSQICTSLLLVNRQIYHEARLLPFQVNDWIFTECFRSSVFSAHLFLAKLETWQRAALRSLEIAVVGREIVERRRREEGWDAVVGLLNDCVRVDVKVKIHEGDVWVGKFNGEMHGWTANGERRVFPGPLRTAWGSVMPVINKGRGGWVQRLLEASQRSEGVRLEFCWSGTDDGMERVPGWGSG